MKTLLFASLTVFAFSAFANHHHHDDMDKMMDSMSFEDAKKMKLEMLTAKSQLMAEAKTCVEGAKDKEGLKACMKTMHEEKRGMKMEMKNQMKKK